VERIRFYYDVVCPYSYMESYVLEAAEDEGTIEVAWLPFELRPAPRPLLQVRGDHRRTEWSELGDRRALAAGLEIPLARYQPRSSLFVAGGVFAAEQGLLRAFKHALYEAFFCEGEDISTDTELRRAAERAGLDPDEIVAAAYDADRHAEIRAIRADAEAAGVRGVPTLLTEDGRSHWGMGGLERLLAGDALVPRQV
jgi:2-hydroxychromene-2-carboxylate isomerase